MTTKTSSRPDNVLIGVGSNLGDRLAWLRFARRHVSTLPGTTILAASSVYETDPVGGPPQGRYLNACLALSTTLAPLALLDALLEIETAAGRVRQGQDAPRSLDLDILVFGSLTLSDARLTVPHPRFAHRPFALVPAAEIAGAWLVPPSDVAVAELAARAGNSGVSPHAGEQEWS